MSEFYLNSTSGKNLTPRKLEQESSSKKASENTSTPKASFQDVLKSVAAKTKAEGSSKIRKDVVEKYKSSLAEGTYEVKAKELAEKMIQKMTENKTRVII